MTQRDAVGRGHGSHPVETVDAVLEALLDGGTPESAGRANGVAPRTVRSWIEDDVGGFRTELEARRKAIREGVDEQRVAAKAAGLAALSEIAMDRKHPDRATAAATLAKLGEVNRVEKSGPGGGPVQHEHRQTAPSLEDAKKVRAQLDELIAREEAKG